VERDAGGLLRCRLGVDPPRRRGRHRPVSPCPAGLARRRYGVGRREAGTRVDQRSRDGRHPARGRRLLGRGRGGPAARGPGTDAGRQLIMVATGSAGVGAFDRMWDELVPVGRDDRTGGYHRFAWTREDHTLREWFAGEAAARGLELVEDRAGNQWAWWCDPDAAPGGGI